MNTQKLIDTAKALVAADKGLLAMDESIPTCNERFARLGIPQTEETRRAYARDIATFATWWGARSPERAVDEINKGGMKIYPGDIDAVVERFEGTVDVCTFAYNDSLYGQNVGLAVVLKDPGDESIRALHDWLTRHIAKHQMPVHWYLLDDIPRTSRGKINRSQVARKCDGLQPMDLRRVLGT